MSFRLFLCMNSFVTFEPNSQPAPRGLTAHASTRSSGSDQTKSQKAPEIITLICVKAASVNGGKMGIAYVFTFLICNYILLPLCGISWLRSINLIWSSVLISGDKPPCTHKTSPSINAATVRRSNTLQQYLQALALPYFVWHSS